MRFLAISTDNNLCDIQSPVFVRQVLYFENVEVDYVLLTQGDFAQVKEGTLRVYKAGGKNKIQVFIKSFLVLFKLVKNTHYNGIISQDVLFTGIIAYFFARLKKIAFFPQLHGDYLGNSVWMEEHWSHKILNSVGKFLLKKATIIRVVSKRIRTDLIENFSLFSDKVVSLPIGADLSIFSPDETVKIEKIILFVGRLVEEKFPMRFCEAAAPLLKKYSDFTAVVVGDGTEKEKMQKFFEAHDLSNRVVFTGKLSPQDLATQYQKAYCLLHPSLREGWGMVMVEAMACGCPVVTTDTGCAGEVVQNMKNGIVVPVQDFSGLVSGLFYIVEHPEARENFSGQSIEDAKKWSFENMKDDLRQLYIDHATK